MSGATVRGRRSRLLAALALLALCCGSFGGCSQFVEYTDRITETESGRTVFVTTPAQLGGSAGFLVGIPADIVLLPATYTFYAVQKGQTDQPPPDAMSVLLFPSFVCWRVGKLLGAPFDLLEFMAWRAWRGEQTLTRAERASIEAQHDENALPVYPVEHVYPTPEWRARAGSSER